MPKYLLRRLHVIEGALRGAGTEVGDGTDIPFPYEPTPYMIAFDAAGQTALDAVNARIFGGAQDLPGFVQLPPAVIPPPSNVDVPYAYQDGDTLYCTMGNWTVAPTSYAYRWIRDGTIDVGTGSTYTVTADDIAHVLTCVVTATNDVGSTVAPPSNGVFVESPVDLRRGAVFAAR
jgi:hypothetical protein